MLLCSLICSEALCLQNGLSHSTPLIRTVLRTEFDDVCKTCSQCSARIKHSVNVSLFFFFLASVSWNPADLASTTLEMCGKSVSGWVQLLPCRGTGQWLWEQHSPVRTEVLLPDSSNSFWVLVLVNYTIRAHRLKCLQVPPGKIHEVSGISQVFIY